MTSLRGSFAVIGTLAALALPAAALAHLERPSYWPDPGPDKSVKPAAGGEVPKARSLGSAATGKGPGDVLVVCKGAGAKRSLALLNNSIAKATDKGYKLRPSQERKVLSEAKAKRLRQINRALADECSYDSVQEAVFDAGNNDRVIVMPGRYTEPKSRKQPINDPRCADLTQQDSSGAETPSYRYQVTCPNDQNLIYVQGREVPDEPPPEPPLDDRQGIPDEGPCVRCNLEIQGSGVKPVDVIFDAGKRYESRGPEAKPGAYAKDVVLRVDRADGFVARNFLARGAKEHGVYVEETDGYLIDKVKMFWAADYGNLTFTSDHGLYKRCDGFGAGDAVLYPGAAPETGEQADTSFYPDAPRINTTIRNCDMRGSVLAYSGSMGNSVRITKNHIYGNVAGISTDTVSAAGHPGYPADSVKVDHNYIYSNNLDLYGMAEPPVEPVVGILPSGVGIFWAGHNNGRVHDNWIFDNWRFGTMLFGIPDALLTPEGSVNQGISCPNPQMTTSCGNQYYDNHLGVMPKNFKPSPAVTRFGNAIGGRRGVLPNGVDFWWDEGATNTGNCWFENVGPDGSPASVTGPGAGSPPDTLPTDCAASVGEGDSAKTAYLLSCFLVREGAAPPEQCDWYTLPPKPGTAAARERQADWARAARRFAEGDRAAEIQARIDELTSIPDSAPPAE